jgi:hypothetical protein
MQELEPCPLACRGKARLEYRPGVLVYYHSSACVTCSVCGARGPIFTGKAAGDDEAVKTLAVDAWNARA